MGSSYSGNKILAWRFTRTFLSVFFILFGTGLPEVDDVGMAKTLAISALSGGLVAVGKALRTWFKENKAGLYQSVIRKLPF